MDPVISLIYRTFFNQEMWRSVGTPNGVAIISALQNLDRNMNGSSIPIRQYDVIGQYDNLISHMAFQFVKRYSTAANL